MTTLPPPIVAALETLGSELVTWAQDHRDSTLVDQEQAVLERVRAALPALARRGAHAEHAQAGAGAAPAAGDVPDLRAAVPAAELAAALGDDHLWARDVGAALVSLSGLPARLESGGSDLGRRPARPAERRPPAVAGGAGGGDGLRRSARVAGAAGRRARRQRDGARAGRAAGGGPRSGPAGGERPGGGDPARAPSRWTPRRGSCSWKPTG